jgi:hypothetical protein
MACRTIGRARRAETAGGGGLPAARRLAAAAAAIAAATAAAVGLLPPLGLVRPLARRSAPTAPASAEDAVNVPNTGIDAVAVLCGLLLPASSDARLPAVAPAAATRELVPATAL